MTVIEWVKNDILIHGLELIYKINVDIAIELLLISMIKNIKFEYDKT